MLENDFGATPEAHINGGWMRGCRCLACCIGRKEIDHGTAWVYRRGCRCDTCKSAHADRCFVSKQEYAARVAANPRKYKHGTYTLYANAKCRCRACVKAKQAANAEGRARWESTPPPATTALIGEGEVYRRRGRSRAFVEVVSVQNHYRVPGGRLVIVAPLGSKATRTIAATTLLATHRPATVADFC